jgi:hypothetical protein
MTSGNSSRFPVQNFVELVDTSKIVITEKIKENGFDVYRISCESSSLINKDRIRRITFDVSEQHDFLVTRFEVLYPKTKDIVFEFRYVYSVKNWVEIKPGLQLPSEVVSKYVSDSGYAHDTIAKLEDIKIGNDIPAILPMPDNKNRTVSDLIEGMTYQFNSEGHIVSKFDPTISEQPEANIEDESLNPSQNTGSTIKLWFTAGIFFVVGIILLLLLYANKKFAKAK